MIQRETETEIERQRETETERDRDRDRDRESSSSSSNSSNSSNIRHYQYLQGTLTGPADDRKHRPSCCHLVQHLEQSAATTPSAGSQHAVRSHGWTTDGNGHGDVTCGTGGLECGRCGDKLWTASCPDTGTCPLPPAGLLLQHTDTGPATQTCQHTDTGPATQTCQHTDTGPATQTCQHTDTGPDTQRHVNTLTQGLQHRDLSTH